MSAPRSNNPGYAYAVMWVRATIDELNSSRLQQLLHLPLCGGRCRCRHRRLLVVVLVAAVAVLSLSLQCLRVGADRMNENTQELNPNV